jgi:class 3 adenylate cyclase
LPTAASDIVLGWVCSGAVESSGAEFAPLGRHLREDAVTEQRVQRRLAAILAADVVGYSALMQRAEEATHAEFERLKRELIPRKRQEHRCAADIRTAVINSSDWQR